MKDSFVSFWLLVIYHSIQLGVVVGVVVVVVVVVAVVETKYACILYLPSLLEGMKERSNETMAATSRMMSVTSCSASHTRRQNVLGGLGGIVLDPNVCRLCSMSFGVPDNPERFIMKTEKKGKHEINIQIVEE